MLSSLAHLAGALWAPAAPSLAGTGGARAPGVLPATATWQHRWPSACRCLPGLGRQRDGARGPGKTGASGERLPSDASASPPEGIRGIAVAAGGQGNLSPASSCQAWRLRQRLSAAAAQHASTRLRHRWGPGCPRRGEGSALPASRIAAGPGQCQAPRGRWPPPGRRRAPRHVLVPLLRAFTFFAALACVADFAGAAVGAIAGQAVASAPAGAGEARVAGCGRGARPGGVSGAGWPSGHPCAEPPCPPHLSHSGSRRNPPGTRRGRSPRSSHTPLRFGKGSTHRRPLLEVGGGWR